MDLYFLEADVPLTKAYTLQNKALTKTPYPFVWDFTSHHETVTSLKQLESVLQRHAALGHCLLKGKITKPLVRESRAGSTTTNDTTEFVVLDLDGLDVKSVDDFLQAIGLSDVSYVVQWSASYGVENKLLRAHIFMLLDKPYTAPLLKQLLIQLNHATPLLHDAMTLTKTCNAIRWPLDVSACQNDKLIYIAPPVLQGLKDPMGKTPRIAYVQRAKPHLSITAQINSTDKNRALTHERIQLLRDAMGLPKRKITYRMHGTTEVMVKPDSCVITEMKTERGFVYFNLNGGDSWAYYHPENNPDYIYNFKGEPAYLTKELLPDYWQQLHSNVNGQITSQGLVHLAFCDRKTSGYWRGTYDTTTDKLELFAAKNETQLRHFAKQVGAPLGDFIPEWDLTFDPNDNVRVDPQNRTINQFVPSPFMLAQSPSKPPTTPPKVIAKIIDNALGSDPNVVQHFYNWLAYIVQRRDRTLTAWVLHGVPGTGKGLLGTNILRPLFGQTQVAMRRMEELNEKYNQFMSNSLLVIVDEVQTKALQNERSVMAKLKNFITEEIVPVRSMFANAAEQRNYTNWLFFSNMPDPVAIDKDDRRFNVGRYQPNKLVITQAEVDQIEKELQAFYHFLLHFPLDADKARSVLHNTDRATMISISESSVDTVADALLSGNFGFFMDELPTDGSYASDTKNFNRVEDYRNVLRKLMARTSPQGTCPVGREELRVLFDYTVGNMPNTPNKFTSLLKHHRVHMDVVWVDSKSVRGIMTQWQDHKMWKQYGAILNPAPPTPPKKPPKVKQARS